ncbi:MAG TPA: hypothetical protein VI451_10850 [Anaerolineales bacterium]|nr:hypothetical protein [Anaerolineales bacterium]
MRPKIHDLIFLLLVLTFLIYAARFIERTSFIINGERYFVLFDDAMISMRYGKNLAEGYGPVWNPGGERVEGFTNPLWVGVMALVHLLPLPLSQMSLPVQILGVLILATNLYFVKKIGDELTSNPLLTLPAVFLTAFFFSLNNWTLQGMEVGLITLLLTISLWIVLRSLKQNAFSYWPYLLMGLASWVRLDAFVAFLAIFLFLAVFDPQHRRQHLLWGLGLFAGFFAVQTIARLVYYGEPLPNTYYLKMGGYSLFDRVQRGLIVYGQFVWTMNWFLYLIPFTILLTRLNRETGLLLFIFLVQSAYSVYVGGDAWEHKGGANRFISIAMPGFFILFVLALDLIRQGILKFKQENRLWVQRITQFALIAIVATSLFSFNTLLEMDSFRKWSTIKRPIFVTGNEDHTITGLLIREITTDEASIAVVSAGAISYFSERFSIDLLGKADKVIAQGDPRPIRGISDDQDFRPGHNKWNYAYSIGELQPDLVVQLWSNSEEAMPFLENDYVVIKLDEYTMYAKKDSPNILWDAIP